MSDRVSIVNATLFEPTSGELTEGDLHIEDGVIVERPSDGGEREVLDAREALLSPGLIDAHIHANAASLDLLKVEASPASYIASHAARRLRLAIERGFTTVRDVAGGDRGLAQAIDEGLIVGPRYLFTGRALSQTGGHGDARPTGLDLCCRGGHLNEVVDGVDDIRRAVRERFRTGAHAIKVHAGGGVVSPSDPLHVTQYSGAEIYAACEEASRRGSYVAAHAYTPDAIQHAVSNGVRTVEHGNLLDVETAQALSERGAYLVPTLVAYDAMARRGGSYGLSREGLAKNARVLQAGKASIETAKAAGVAIGFGTDLMGELEDEQLQEFRLRLDAGDSVATVLRSATVINAEIIKMPELATLATGSPADVVVFDGDPFADASVLWSPRRFVLRAGKRML